MTCQKLSMVADPGNPDKGIPRDPTNGEPISNPDSVKVDIAYGGSCTAGKIDDIASRRVRLSQWMQE